MKKGLTYYILTIIISVLFVSNSYAESRWIKFNNPNSKISMERQIHQTVLRMAQQKQFTNAAQVKQLEAELYRQKQRIEDQWEKEFNRLDTELRNAFEQVSMARSGLSSYQAANKMLQAKKKQLNEQKVRLREHNNSLQASLDNIPYAALVVGGYPQERSRKETSEIMAAAMGQLAVKTVNNIEIKSLTVVKNNQLVSELIQSSQKGHYKVAEGYDEPLEDVDTNTFKTAQIEFSRFLVFPFATSKSLSRSGSEGKGTFSIITENNYYQVLKKFNLNNDKRLMTWVENQIDKIRSRNTEVEQTIQNRVRKWKRRQLQIEDSIRKLEFDVRKLKNNLQNTTQLDLRSSEKNWQRIYNEYQTHLKRRSVWQRKQESRSLNTSLTREQHWAMLGRETLSALQDIAGDYQENILVSDNMEQGYEEKSITFKETKEAFKVLYITLSKSRNRIIYTTAVAYQVRLTPASVLTNRTAPAMTVPEKIEDSLNIPIETADTTASPSEMIRIPSGTFIMGSNQRVQGNLQKVLRKPKGKYIILDAGRRYSKYLNTFMIDKTEVTNLQYQAFVIKNNYRTPGYWSGGRIPAGWQNKPVVNVSWLDAYNYCRTQGKRLPTSEEWEKAFRGRNGLIFPWGATFSKNMARTISSLVKAPMNAVRENRDISPYGVMHMAGNVSEWVSTLFRSRLPNMKYRQRVIRGGSWALPYNYSVGWFLTAAAEKEQFNDVGFRCAK